MHTYRTLADARTVRSAAESASAALVIGGGFIGMETTASLRRRGLAVTQIDIADHLYASLQAPPLSHSLERLYREKGVDVLLGDQVAEFHGSAGKLTGARRARARDQAELAIVGVGVQPSTGYLEGCGVELERGTVLVDERFASNVPGIWAVGDIACFHDPVFGHRRLIQHWTNANHQGERLGRLLAGEDAPYDQVAFFFSEVFGTKIGLLGDLDGGHDELVMRGSLEAGALIGWYLRDGRLVGGARSSASRPRCRRSSTASCAGAHAWLTARRLTRPGREPRGGLRARLTAGLRASAGRPRRAARASRPGRAATRSSPRPIDLAAVAAVQLRVGVVAAGRVHQHARRAVSARRSRRPTAAAR